MRYSEGRLALDIANFHTDQKRALTMQNSRTREYIKLAWSVATGKRHSFRLERMIAKLPRHANSSNRTTLSHAQEDLILDIKRRIK